MQKRIISMFLCVLMVLSSMGGAVFAAEEPVTVEEPIVEETVPPVDEFEVVDPHPLEGTVTEDVPGETEDEPIELSDSTVSDSVISESVSIQEIPVVYPDGFLTPSLAALHEWQEDYAEPSTPFEGSEGYEDASMVGVGDSVQTASTYSTGYSNDYKTGKYYTRLQTALDNLTGDELVDIIAVAESQVGYHEGNSESDLDGLNTNGTLDYTEYGRWFDSRYVAEPWCAMFICWCAAQAGIGTDTIARSASAGIASTYGLATGVGSFVTYSFSAVRQGDIISFNNGTHVALVVNKTSTYIETVEGNTGDYCVKRNKYYTNHNSTSTWDITHYFRPDYERCWREIDGEWYYYDAGSSTPRTGWQTIGGITYYFDPAYNGRMVTGWKEIGGEWYYFSEESPLGEMVTGWQEINGYWYYFDPTDGTMFRSGWKDIFSQRYYFQSDGKMLTGFQTISNNIYYFRESETSSGSIGAMAKGWALVNGDYYYFDPNTGIRQVGWKTISNYTYYLDPTTGIMATSWKQISGKWYYFRPETNDNGPRGSKVTGWVSYNDNWYYLEAGSNGAMVTEWRVIYSASYDAYYTYYFTTNGAMVTDWEEISGVWYYFRPSANDNGPQGSRVSGWIPYNGYWYYADPNDNGAMVTGWKDIDEETYYFMESEHEGRMVTGWQEIDSVWYRFNSDGELQKGWYSNTNYTYYLDPVTGAMTVGWRTIDGIEYYFDESGHLVE